MSALVSNGEKNRVDLEAGLDENERIIYDQYLKEEAGDLNEEDFKLAMVVIKRFVMPVFAEQKLDHITKNDACLIGTLALGEDFDKILNAINETLGLP